MPNMDASGAGWIWFGYAGHFVGGKRCVFHLSTWLPNGWLVSTVGHYLPRSGDGETPEEIGIGRTFETMVFKCRGTAEPGVDAPIDDWSAVETKGYNDSSDAERGHYAVCAEWADKPVEAV
jgi:hypothetical protein